jgi:hypothetical protein
MGTKQGSMTESKTTRVAALFDLTDRVAIITGVGCWATIAERFLQPLAPRCVST